MVAFQDVEINIPAYLAFMYTCLMVVCIGIVVYYAEPGFPWHTYLTLIVGYFCSFGVLLLVPVDIAVVIIDRRSTFPLNDPTYNGHVKTLSAAYSTFFTIILIFGSFVLVFEEYYNTDGKLIAECAKQPFELVSVLLIANQRPFNSCHNSCQSPTTLVCHSSPPTTTILYPSVHGPSLTLQKNTNLDFKPIPAMIVTGYSLLTQTFNNYYEL